MLDTPLVSFIIISYKHVNYIADCLESILDQSYSNMEILYLDDASGDGTFQKACDYRRKLEEKYSRVIFIENSRNKGLISNLNLLIQMCRGKYVKFLAADDFMLGNGIEKMVNTLEKYQEYDMIYSNGIIGDENTHYPYTGSVNKDRLIYKQTSLSGANLFPALYEKDFISAPGVMTRKVVYDKVGLYDQTIGVEDWDYYLRIAKDGVIGYLHTPTVIYRILSSSLSHSPDPNRRINMRKSELRILEKHREGVKNADVRMQISLNEAIQDAFHIDDQEYLSYLYSYAKRNALGISFRNRMKSVLYKLGIIRYMECERK